MENYFDELRNALKGIGINAVDFREIIPVKPEENLHTRKVTVTYDPEGDMDDLDYVKVEAVGLDKDKNANRGDVMALALATAKLLANQCPGIDEHHAGVELMKSIVALQIEGLAHLFTGGKKNG